MNWLERAAREISGTAGTPAAETAKTPVSSVLAVPQTDISKESGAADADRAAPERAKPKFAGPPPAPARPCAPACVSGRSLAMPRTDTAGGSRWKPGARTRSAVSMAGRQGSLQTAIRKDAHSRLAAGKTRV